MTKAAWHGFILEAPQGEGGFGYDPYFWLPEYRNERGGAEPFGQKPPEPSRHRDADIARATSGARGPGRARVIDASLALYVHMPWCVRKCPYCDFNSHQLKSAAPDGAYIDALLQDFDMELPRLRGRRIDTVFFGGGTPSLFKPEDFARLLVALRQRIAFADGRGNYLGGESRGPSSAAALQAMARQASIACRLGAQSFVPRALKALGRIHSADDTHRAVDGAAAAKLGNFNLDLMYALPGQTLEEALRDVQHRLRAGPHAHLLLSAHARARHGVSFAAAGAAG